MGAPIKPSSSPGMFGAQPSSSATEAKLPFGGSTATQPTSSQPSGLGIGNKKD